MQGKRLVVLTAAVLWLGIFAMSHFSPSESELLLRYAGWSKYSGAALPNNFASELPFPIPAAVLSLAGWTVPVSSFLFSLPNMIFGLGAIILLAGIAPASFSLFFAGSLWTVWAVMSSFATALTLFWVSLILYIQLKSREGDLKEISLAFIVLWLSATSLPGWIFALIFWAYKMKSNFSLKTAGVGGAIILYSLVMSVIPYIKQNAGQNSLAINDNLAQEVNSRVRFETKLNNYSEPVPLLLKRIVYNKPYFAYRQISRQIAGMFSLEKAAFPGQEGATVARSLWGSKGLPWVYFWILPTAALGIFLWKRVDEKMKFAVIILAVWGSAGMIAGRQENWLTDGIGLFVSGLLLVSWLLSKLKSWQKATVYLLFLLSAIPALYHFIAHEEVWRDNRPLVQKEMALQATNYGACQVTTILGRSFLYYGWLNRIAPAEFWQGVEAGMKINGVKFDHFETPQTNGVYIGLPGEFLGSKKEEGRNEFSDSNLPPGWLLLESERIADSVSFGNGDFIWAIDVRTQK